MYVFTLVQTIINNELINIENRAPSVFSHFLTRDRSQKIGILYVAPARAVASPRLAVAPSLHRLSEGNGYYACTLF